MAEPRLPQPTITRRGAPKLPANAETLDRQAYTRCFEVARLEGVKGSSRRSPAKESKEGAERGWRRWKDGRGRGLVERSCEERKREREARGCPP